VGVVHERRMLALSVASTVLFVVAGVLLASVTRRPQWVQRSGSAVVAVEALIAVAADRRQKRLARIPSAVREANPYVEIAIARAESQLMWVAIALAVSGELLNGFGDLLFCWLSGCAHRAC